MRLPSAHAQDVAAEAIALEESRRSHLVVALVGAHAGGYATEDDPLLLRGVHLADSEDFLGLKSLALRAESRRAEDHIELHYESAEVGGVLLGLLKGNAGYAERLLSPLLLLHDDAVDELQPLVRRSFSKRMHRSYRSYAWQQRKEAESAIELRCDKLLGILHTALTGTHLLLTGELELDILELAGQHHFSELSDLIERRDEEHLAVLATQEAHHWRGRVDEILRRLDDAVISSPLPDMATTEDALDDWLVRLRRRRLAA